ncbi:DUF7691 family protein [Streptomyces yaizuensis]|uniref:DUF7691 domain-containing protein n=1 Tax=Streptomyces yaizuensis TaxID=2989713 RepID=A0ABQ5P656_9ACTN|nr:hypothetical protein [Streptomyces sp. YSPA8]GLF98087.1 hypothetical protein SYYSPA8_27340 [Streptomyces sp. YSPA8]
MSSSLSVYRLDTTAARALIGSRDDQLLELIHTRFADDLARADDEHAYEIEQGAPTAEQALRAVIHSGPFSENQNHTFQYGYAYKRLCSLTGVFLPNDCFTPHRGDWLAVVDQGLETLGITAVSVEAFSQKSPPHPLPYTWTPGCAEWTPASITQALEQFDATKRAADGSGQAPPLESEVVDAVQQCIGWMRQAHASGQGVIGFRS